MKERNKRIGHLVRHLYQLITNTFPSSDKYWEQRYSSCGNSGGGSYDKLAQFKSEILNSFVENHDIATVIELGCGDGNQLSLANYPTYIGFDISKTAIDICKERFSTDSTKTFKSMNDYNSETADLLLSLDVLYHLVEYNIFEDYMRILFKASNKYVIIYSSNSDYNPWYQGRHIRHRAFTQWIDRHLQQWILIDHIQNRYPHKWNYRTRSFADFYIYGKKAVP